MKVIQIQQKKKYALLITDTDETIFVAKDYIKQNNISIDSDIAYQACTDANSQFAYQFAMDSAFNYLSYAARTEKQLRDHLSKKTLPSEVIEKVMEKLREYKYADDVTYADMFTKNAITDRKGKHYIQNKLRQKGVEDDKIEQALLQYDEDSEERNIIEYIDKQNQALKKYPPTIRKEKLFRKAMSRGFSTEQIANALNKIDKEDQNDYSAYYTKLIDKKCENCIRKNMSKKDAFQKLYGYFARKGANSDLIRERVDFLYRDFNEN